MGLELVKRLYEVADSIFIHFNKDDACTKRLGSANAFMCEWSRASV